jgi:hypothetical protein
MYRECTSKRNSGSKHKSAESNRAGSADVDVGIVLLNHHLTDPSKRFGAAGDLFHLFTFGLVAAGTAMLFGLAFFSLFGISRETLLRPPSGGSTTRFYPRTAVAPCTKEHAPIKIDPPSLPDTTIPLVLLAQNPTISDLLSQEPGPRLNVVLLPDNEASAATQDTSHASAIQGPVTDKLPPAQLSASQQAVTEAAPAADAASAIVDQERDRLLLVAGIRNSQPTALDQANKEAHETASVERPPPKASYSSYHPLNPKAVFRYHARKECGPIDDLELRRDCIASFHYLRNRPSR